MTGMKPWRGGGEVTADMARAPALIRAIMTGDQWSAERILQTVDGDPAATMRLLITTANIAQAALRRAYGNDRAMALANLDGWLRNAVALDTGRAARKRASRPA